MNPEQSIQQFASQPLTHQLLTGLLKEYKRPNDKINEWLKQGQLISLKRGLYVWNAPQLPELFSIANVLSAPSYVSAESALSFRGLIPEKVFTIISMSFISAKNFQNSLGSFEYKKIPLPYYSFGIAREELSPKQFALVATAEKALLDKVIITSGTVLRSVSAAQRYLLDNLRIDEEQLKGLDVEKMKSWLPDSPKKESIQHIIKAVETI